MTLRETTEKIKEAMKPLEGRVPMGMGGPKGLWIHGAPGVGKSMWVRIKFG